MGTPTPYSAHLVKKETPCRLERTSRTHNLCFLHVLPGLKGGFSVFVGCALSPYSPGSGACADTKGQKSSDSEVARGWSRVSHGPVTPSSAHWTSVNVALDSQNVLSAPALCLFPTLCGQPSSPALGGPGAARCPVPKPARILSEGTSSE